MTLTSSANISYPVWVQAFGRLLYQLGSAVLIFYTPILFVNYGHLSASAVGLAVGIGSIAGFFGNLLGGGMTDSHQFGRKGTLLVAAGLAIAAATVTVLARDFWVLLLANVLFGISTGLYWTAADAAIMDVTEAEHRQHAFSVLGVMDSLGFGLGTLGGGVLLKWLHPVNLMFSLGAIAFAGFLVLIVAIMTEPQRHPLDWSTPQSGWKTAIADKRLMTYLLVNTLFVTFIMFVNNTLPLYFVNFGGTPETLVSNLFTWGYIGLGTLLQIPLIRWLAGLSYLRSLMLSMAIWGFGFLMTWQLGRQGDGGLSSAGWELANFGMFAIATVLYKPTSSAWIAELAPPALRGVYTAIAYQCWSIGFVIGPILGGWAIDQAAPVLQEFWLSVAGTTLLGLLVLQWLDQRHRMLSIRPTVKAALLLEDKL